MTKILVEVCLISARGIHHQSSFIKHQRYAVGWIDPNNKYRTSIDSSNNPNPKWETKFSTIIDTSSSSSDHKEQQDLIYDLVLEVEVYSRDPIFLREKLLGTATVNLKEFVEKYLKGSFEVSRSVEEQGSFQLRKKKVKKCNDQAQGFVDLSIRVSQERGVQTSYSGEHEGIVLMNHGNNYIHLNKKYGAQQKSQTQQMGIHPQEAGGYGGIRHPVLRARDHSSIPTGGSTYASQPSQSLGGGTNFPPPPPQPPHLPLNGGYMPSSYPRIGNVVPSCINFPSSSTGQVPKQGSRSGFGMGLGGGALAAGAMIFGDDFMSGFDVDVARSFHDSPF